MFERGQRCKLWLLDEGTYSDSVLFPCVGGGSELDLKVSGPFSMSMDAKGCPGLNITV